VEVKGMAIVLFGKNTKQEEKFGRSDSAGTGFAIYANCEVLKAEYERETEGKKEIKLTSGGAKKIRLALRVQREIEKQDGSKFNTGEVIFVSTFEKEAKSGVNKEGKEWSFPAVKLKDLKPETTMKDGKEIITKPKYVRITAENGGSGIAGFNVSTSIAKEGRKNAGEIQSTINVRMPNIEIPFVKEGKRLFNSFGKEVPFKVDERAYVKLKGFFDPIKSTEEFLEKNCDKERKTLKVRFFYSQSAKKEDGSYYEVSPILLVFKYNNFDEDIMGDFGLLRAIKDEYKDKIVHITGHLEQIPVYSKVKSKTKRQFGKVKSGEKLGYEVALIVNSTVENEGDSDEWLSFAYEATGYDGKLTIKKDDAPLIARREKTATEKEVDTEVDEDDVEDVTIDDEELDLEDDLEVEDSEESTEEDSEDEEEQEEEEEEETPPPAPKKTSKATAKKKPEPVIEEDEEDEEEEKPQPKKATPKKSAKKEVEPIEEEEEEEETPAPKAKATPKKETAKKAVKEEEEEDELDLNIDDIDLGDMDLD
jgi:hypothetical protein